jgi:translation initiation factor 1 (eIF-1/SUI1)
MSPFFKFEDDETMRSGKFEPVTMSLSNKHNHLKTIISNLDVFDINMEDFAVKLKINNLF